MPISAPMPTADIGCDLVKISASGPMPTSRYCDHACCAISTSFRRAASGEPGPHAGEIVADDRDDRPCAPPSAFAGSPARLLFDHALEHARDERDAARLDRLQVAGGEKPRPSFVAPVPRELASIRRAREPRQVGRGANPGDGIIELEQSRSRWRRWTVRS